MSNRVEQILLHILFIIQSIKHVMKNAIEVVDCTKINTLDNNQLS